MFLLRYFFLVVCFGQMCPLFNIAEVSHALVVILKQKQF